MGIVSVYDPINDIWKAWRTTEPEFYVVARTDDKARALLGTVPAAPSTGRLAPPLRVQPTDPGTEVRVMVRCDLCGEYITMLATAVTDRDGVRAEVSPEDSVLHDRAVHRQQLHDMALTDHRRAQAEKRHIEIAERRVRTEQAFISAMERGLV